ncbi:MAG: glycosyltransferase [Sulfurovum sp.]|nr:glycosyltransferase [Sulfurovum sp.]
MEQNRIKKLVVIIGINRSGLTLLEGLIGSHSQMTPWFLPYSTRRQQGILPFTTIESIHQEYQKAYRNETIDTSILIISQDSTSPKNLAFIQKSLENLEKEDIEIQIICISRNIYHTFLSQKEAGYKYWKAPSLDFGYKEFEAYMKFAKKGYTQIRALLYQYSHSIVSYENLITQPEQMICQIAKYLDIDDEDLMSFYSNINLKRVAGDPGFLDYDTIISDKEEIKKVLWEKHKEPIELHIGDIDKIFSSEYNRLVNRLEVTEINSIQSVESVALERLFDENICQFDNPIAQMLFLGSTFYYEYCKRHSISSVDIILPVYNALDDVKLCIESLYETASEIFNLIVVDDASNEETKEYLLKLSKEKGFTLIRHEKNMRFTHSVNSGFSVSDADYVILLNSDTIVTTNWIEKIISCFKSDENIGIVGVLSNAASWQSIPQRSKPQGGWMVNTLPQNYTIGQMGLLIEILSKQAYPKVPSVNGFCYSIKRTVINDIGIFDTEYFPTGYGEEDDYSIRATDAGYQIAIADDTYIYHAKSKSYTDTIREQLTANGRISLDKKHGKERIDTLITEWKLDTFIAHISSKIQNFLHYSTGNKKVVYTAIFGNYDELKEPEYINKDWDYICFTDNPTLSSDIYIIKYLEPLFENSTKNARMFKLLSHIFLIGYDYSLWIDGSVKIRGKNINYLIEELNKKNHYLSIHSHIKRDCIYDEGMACILAEKASASEVLTQMKFYKAEAFPEKRGLVESAEILRNHRNPSVQILNEQWWKTIDTFSLRDQLAFNYVCWKESLSYHKMSGTQWLDQYFHIYPHTYQQPTDDLPNVELALLSYSNDLEVIENTLDNIVEYTNYSQYSITILFTEESIYKKVEIEKFIQKYDNVHYLLPQDNDNDTAMINKCIAQSKQERVCILNESVSIILSDWLKILASHSREKSSYMAVGPIIFNKDFLLHSSFIRIQKYNQEK